MWILLIFLTFTFIDGTISTDWESFCDAGIPEEISVIGEGRGNISFPESSVKKSWLVHVNENILDGIEIELMEFILEDYFLVLRKGDKMEDAQSEIQFVSGHSDKALKFKIPYTKSFYIEICPESSSEKPGKFTLVFTRSACKLGDDPLPEEPPEHQKERESVEVQFKVKPPLTFSNPNFVKLFQEAVRNIARDYCALKNYTFDLEKPASDMVAIHSIRRCPYEWYDRDVCASVQHSVYVSGSEELMRSIWNYELSRQHLREMWTTADSKHLENIGISIFKLPDVIEVMDSWLLTTIVPMALLTIFSLVIFSACRSEQKMGRETVHVETEVTEKRRKSELRPNKYQTIPSFITDVKANTRREYHATQTDGIQTGPSYFAALLFPRYKLMETCSENR